MLACLAIACLATGSWQNEEQFGPLGVRNNSIPQRIMVGECEKAFYPPSFFLPTRFSPLHVILLYFERASTNDGTRQLLHLTSASLSPPPPPGGAPNMLHPLRLFSDGGGGGSTYTSAIRYKFDSESVA